MSERPKPGDTCQESGLYVAFTPWGEQTFTKKKMDEGKIFPPTPFAGCYFKRMK